MAYRLVVLASGSGTLAQAIFDARVDLECEILAVITDNPAAPVLVKAQAVGIATDVLAVGASRHEWNLQMIARVGAEKPDLVVSAGFMRILPPDFVNRFPTINIHPALLPNFPGAHAVRDALAAGTAVTGTTVHWVDDGIDTGPVITQMEVPIVPGDDEATLHERIKKVERGLIVATIALILPTLERHV